MEYNSKTNWQRDDIVTEKDLNRMEQGIKDAHGKLKGIQEGAEVNRPISDAIDLDDSDTSASSKAVKTNADKIGILETLTTENKLDLVNAINEVHAQKPDDYGRFVGEFGLNGVELNNCYIDNDDKLKLSNLIEIKQEARSSSLGVSINEVCGQKILSSFLVSNNISAVSFIDIYIDSKTGTPENLILSLYDETTSNILASISKNANAIIVNSMNRFTFDTSIPINKDNNLQIRLSTSESNPSYYFRVSFNSSSVQNNTNLIRSNDNWGIITDYIDNDLTYNIGYTTVQTSGTATKTIIPQSIEKWGNLKVTASDISVNNSASVDINEIITKANTWDESTGTAPSDIWSYSAAIGDKIYAKGSDGKKMWIYDTTTNTWDELSGGTTSSSWNYAVSLDDKIYVKGSDGKKIWIYDTINNTWDESSGAIPSGSWDYPIAIGTKIYVRQGNLPYKVWIYDTITNTWDESTGTVPSGSWTYSTAIGDRIYAKGSDGKKIWIYDTINNTWDESSGAALSGSWTYLIAIGTKIYVRQGVSPYKVWIYDTTTNTWDESTGTAPSDIWSYSVAIGDKIYAQQGVSPYELWIYNTTNKYTNILPTQPLTNGENTIDLSSIDVAQYPEITTIFNLQRNTISDLTPQLSNSSWTWKGDGKREDLLYDNTLENDVASVEFDVDSDVYSDIYIVGNNINVNTTSGVYLNFNNSTTNSYSYNAIKTNSSDVIDTENTANIPVGVMITETSLNKFNIYVNLETNLGDFKMLGDSQSYYSKAKFGWFSFLKQETINHFSLKLDGSSSFKSGSHFKVIGVKKLGS